MNNEQLFKTLSDSFNKSLAIFHEELKSVVDAVLVLEDKISEIKKLSPLVGEKGDKGENGLNATDEQVMAAVAKYFSDNPVKHGVDGKDGKDGVDGKDADPVDIKSIALELANNSSIKTVVDLSAAEAVGEYFQHNPVKHGIDGKDGANGKDGERGEKGDAGQDGKSITLEDVSMIMETAVSKAMLELERRTNDTITKAIERIPVPKDGKDGRDGVAPFVTEFDGVRTLTVKNLAGEVVKLHKLAVPVHRGYWRNGMTFEKGDIVTEMGSAWIAVRDTDVRPDIKAVEDWCILARAGRNGDNAMISPVKASESPIKLQVKE